MGTKADFYIKSGDALEWQGSLEWDCNEELIPDEIVQSSCKEEFIINLENALKIRKGFHPLETGWPWLWNTSKQTDYAYILVEEKGTVYISKHNSPCYSIYDYRNYKKRAKAARLKNKEIEDFPSYIEKVSPFTPSFPKMK